MIFIRIDSWMDRDLFNSLAIFNIPHKKFISHLIRFYHFSFSFYEYSFFINNVFYNNFNVTNILSHDFYITFI